MFSVLIFCQGYERAQNYSLAYCDLRLQVFLHDIVVHHEAAADVGDDGVRLMKTEVFVDFDSVKILFVDGEIDCGEFFRLTERFDEIERGARQATAAMSGGNVELAQEHFALFVRHKADEARGHAVVEHHIIDVALAFHLAVDGRDLSLIHISEPTRRS